MPSLPPHVALTIREILAAYALAVAAGVWLGLVLGLQRIIGRIYAPLLAALYAVPSVVWYPSLMLFFGLGPASKIAFGFLLGFFPVVLAVLAGIRQVPAHLITIAVSMGARPATVFRKVMLPSMSRPRRDDAVRRRALQHPESPDPSVDRADLRTRARHRRAERDALRGVSDRAHADESIRIVAKGIGWPEAAARRAYGIVRPLLSLDGKMDLDAMKFMQDTLLELGVLKQRLPLDQHYTSEFTPVKI